MWHEARRSERKVHAMMDAAKKRAEKRAERRRGIGGGTGDLQEALRVMGTPCKLHRDSAVHAAAENLQGLSVPLLLCLR